MYFLALSLLLLSILTIFEFLICLSPLRLALAYFITLFSLTHVIRISWFLHILQIIASKNSNIWKLNVVMANSKLL